MAKFDFEGLGWGGTGGSVKKFMIWCKKQHFLIIAGLALCLIYLILKIFAWLILVFKTILPTALK